MKIRDYLSDDIEQVVELFRSNIPKYFVPDEEQGLRDYLAEYPDNYYVIELDGDIVGAGGIALNDDDTVSLCWGMVHNDHLGTGLGKMLTEYRIERSREIFGNKPMVNSTSQLTEGFYHKLGFVTVEHTPNGFGPGIDICKMRLG
ncbi:MAG: GNAT family N-acetyltransferase [Blastocatellia bacterium]|nr:GNAT family N-acetyltransferase [Blastocatellia bacterium]